MKAKHKPQKKSGKGENKCDKDKPSGSNTFTSIAFGVITCWIGVYLSSYFVITTTDSRDTRVIIGKEFIARKNLNISCSNDYKDYPIFKGCTPTKICGRVVRDDVVSKEEAEVLLSIAKRGFAHGGSNGGASILDLHSGALSKGDKFIDIFKSMKREELRETFRQQDFDFYADVRSRVHSVISEEFGIDHDKLYLTHPTFFSSITNKPAKTMHDEYWHKHIDKIQYGSFDYTSLLYLSDHDTDFSGGEFVFDDDRHSMTVKPKKGRLSFFTSGSENPHHVEKVTSGTRYAMTISFTCDPSKGIKDPSYR